MKNRCFYIIHSFLSIFIGAFIYIVFRSNTYIHNFLNIKEPLLSNINFYGDQIIRYALPDFLWCYSFTMLIYAILMPVKNKSLIVCISCIIFGILWEILQLLSIITGTFDLIDCFMYILAAIISYIIYIKRGH